MSLEDFSISKKLLANRQWNVGKADLTLVIISREKKTFQFIFKLTIYFSLQMVLRRADDLVSRFSHSDVALMINIKKKKFIPKCGKYLKRELLRKYNF